jgi:acrylyl-CoA reductase (NADPH)
MFHAVYLSKATDNSTLADIRELHEDELPQIENGAVTVKVDFSTINYKDGLAITGRSPVVRKFPMVPGIDFCGTVLASAHPDWQAGDQVILNGFGVGESHWGGLAQIARVSGDWLIRRPASLSSKDAMAVGTAGYTAMLCVMALERHGVTPAGGEILVTGATGGVGSFAVSLLASLGYRVVASTGKQEESAFLQSLGAAEVIDRAALSAAGKPLQKERWGGVVDTVGSHTLANACAATRYGGVVTACGLAQGMDLPLTVAPFILRGVSLIGVDSVMAPRALRERAWARLAQDLQRASIDAIAHTVGLAQALPAAEQILSGLVRGRVVVDVNL